MEQPHPHTSHLLTGRSKTLRYLTRHIWLDINKLKIFNKTHMGRYNDINRPDSGYPTTFRNIHLSLIYAHTFAFYVM